MRYKKLLSGILTFSIFAFSLSNFYYAEDTQSKNIGDVKYDSEEVQNVIDDVVSNSAIDVNNQIMLLSEDNISYGVYSVPVKMVNASDSNRESMGNAGIDGNAIVRVEGNSTTIDMSFKAVSVSGLYGHLVNMWSYPTTDTMDYSWWNDSKYETLAEIIEYYEDFGLGYTDGDLSKSQFPKVIRLERTSVGENSIYIRISVDAMEGFDQVARLDLDWDNAELVGSIENTTAVTESTSEATTESTTENTTEQATSESSGGGGGNSNNSDDIQDGKYWVEINLWNSNIDQASMGNTAFENNRDALVTISNGVAYVEVATNPVSVSGYTSALQSIESSDVNINVLKTESFTTNTKFDGSEHSFTYVSKFSFETSDLDEEYIGVKISVPFTPMDGVSANADGWLNARLKLSWSSMEKTDDSTVLNPDSSTASGVSENSGAAVSLNDEKTGIKIEAEEFIFEDGTDFEFTEIVEGEDFNTVSGLLENDVFRAYRIKATYNNEEVQPSGQITLYIPISENDSDSIEIYRVSEGSKATSKILLEYSISEDGKYYVVNVRELGILIIADKGETVEVFAEIVEDSLDNVEIAVDNKTGFSDIDGHWAKDSIERAVEIGLFSGTGKNEFTPNGNTTRAMFITVLGRLAGVNTNISGDKEFKDVIKSDYFYPYVMWGIRNGITSGISENYFGANSSITREQAAVMLYNFAKNQGIELKSLYSVTDFNDGNKISDWALEAVNTLVKGGVISGRENGDFEPKKSATRAEIATMLVRFVDEYMNI